MPSRIERNASKKLVEIGFTQLESDVYLYLLINGPGTGYRIAKGINKAIANVYKAVDSLAQKGAVTHANTGSKLCSAVPWEQFLASEKKRYLSNIDSLSEQLEKIPARAQDEQVHQLVNVDQVFGKSIQIIESAQSIVLLDLQPDSVKWLKEAITAAAERGVEVRAKVYEEVELPGVHLTLRADGKEVYGKTRDIEYAICADGSDLLIALISEDETEVIQAIQTRSSLMNLRFYCGLLYELILTDIKRVVPDGDIEAVRKILSQTNHLHPFSSENTVFQRFKERYQPQRN